MYKSTSSLRVSCALTNDHKVDRYFSYFNLQSSQVQVMFSLWDLTIYLEQIKYVVAAAITLKGIGGVLFIFGSSFGAFLLVL